MKTALPLANRLATTSDGSNDSSRLCSLASSLTPHPPKYDNILTIFSLVWSNEADHIKCKQYIVNQKIHFAWFHAMHHTLNQSVSPYVDSIGNQRRHIHHWLCIFIALYNLTYINRSTSERTKQLCFMMTSSNGNIFRVTGHLCGEFTGEFPTQRPVTRSFDVFFDLHPNKRLSKQWWGWWFETPSSPLWRHRNVT